MVHFNGKFVSSISIENLEKLRLVVGDGPVLILTHDNPDPDGLASGAVLARLFAEWGASSHLLYNGLVERVENKTMLELLTPEWEHIEEFDDFDSYPCILLVDTQPKAGNNSLPDNVLPSIVIDHHLPVRQGVRELPYTDIRPDVGATASMAYQYLHAAGIQPDSILATALFYGIQADTRGLSRSDSKVDQWVYFELLSLIDRDLLIKVEQAGLPRIYFSAFCKGLQAAKIYHNVVTAYLGEMHRPDFVAEIADMLIRLKEAEAVLCMGWHDRTLYLSMRTMPAGQDAGKLIQQIVLPPGKAGGHGTMAGGQVPLVGQDVEQLVEQLVARFLLQMGQSSNGKPLLE